MTRSDGSALPSLPADGDRALVAREMLRTSDELPWMVNEEPEPEPDPTRPEVALHVHQLCGHDCISGACSTLSAICLSCEFALQDDRARHNSRGMDKHNS